MSVQTERVAGRRSSRAEMLPAVTGSACACALRGVAIGVSPHEAGCAARHRWRGAVGRGTNFNRVGNMSWKLNPVASCVTPIAIGLPGFRKNHPLSPRYEEKL